jgi:hypothetical protein
VLRIRDVDRGAFRFHADVNDFQSALSFAPRMRSSSVKRSLTTDFDTAKRRAAPVIEPVFAIAAKASTDRA